MQTMSNTRGISRKAKLSRLKRTISKLETELAAARRELGNLQGGLASGKARLDVARLERVYAEYLKSGGGRGTIKALAAKENVNRRTIERDIAQAKAREMDGTLRAAAQLAYHSPGAETHSPSVMHHSPPPEMPAPSEIGTSSAAQTGADTGPQARQRARKQRQPKVIKSQGKSVIRDLFDWSD